MSGPDASRGAQKQVFAISIADFITDVGKSPPPLIGSVDDCILPAYGLLLLIAKGGKGKTTLTIDAILHLASGIRWLGIEVPRPLRVLLIENEGPREPFRRKLERRLGNWRHPLKGEIFVYAENWGQARLDADSFIDRLNDFVGREQIDLIVGDPLDTLGMEGNGAPKDTREMVARLQRAGLFTRVAWWILHHARKERADDAIDEASGSWAGKPDALLGLEKLRGDGARLGFHKLRWGLRDGFALQLGYDPEAEVFELLGEAQDHGEPRDYLAEVEELLADGQWRTSREISATREEGIGAKREVVERLLNENPGRFASCTGSAARAMGRRPNATLWSLAPTAEPVEPDGPEPDATAPLASGSPRREPEPASHIGGAEGVQARNAEPDSGGTGSVSHREAAADDCRYRRAATDGAVE